MAGDAEVKAVREAIGSGWMAPAGPALRRFEADLAERISASAALAVTSGTAALHLGLLGVGVTPGDEVVVQTTTFAASAFAVQLARATPVFGDVDRATGMLDPDALSEFLALRARQNRLPAAVMPVDLYGWCADYQRIREVCQVYEIPIVQDSAEALGAVSQGTPGGRHGDVAAFSFNGNKIITTSGGGALVGTPAQVKRAAKLASQAKEPTVHFEHWEMGYNYRLSNLLAAVGSAQLATLDQRIEQKRRVRDAYHSLLPDLQWFPDGVTERPNYWLNVALLPSGVDPSSVAVHLQDAGIEARPSWMPMHRQPVFSETPCYGGSVADEFFARGICLPSGGGLDNETVSAIAEVLMSAIEFAPESVGVH